VTYPNAHGYVSVIGSAYGGTEKWQFGFRIDPAPVGNQATADTIAPYVQAWWKATAPYVAGVDRFGSLTTHTLDEVKVAQIDVDGKYKLDVPSASHFFVPVLVGTDAPAAGQLPQGTVVATLTTALPRGLASKGRIFLPPSSEYLPGADGRIPVGGADHLRDSVLKLIRAINGDALVGNVTVFSRGRGVPAYNADKHRVEYTFPNPGSKQIVTGVRVGRVVDTQRRRRRSLLETPEAGVV
jgi:hypothetical protein